MTHSLVRTINLPQVVALYVAAVVGTGVLILSGLAATRAGPASVLAWIFDCLLGIPLALMFVALANRYPDAGSMATVTKYAFGPGLGSASGWFYFMMAATGQIIGPLTGAYYAAAALSLERGVIFVSATAILVVAVAANLRTTRERSACPGLERASRASPSAGHCGGHSSSRWPTLAVCSRH